MTHVYPAELCDVILVLNRKQLIFVTLVDKRVRLSKLLWNDQMRDPELALFLNKEHIVISTQTVLLHSLCANEWPCFSITNEVFEYMHRD